MSRFRRKLTKNDEETRFILWKFEPRTGSIPLFKIQEKKNDENLILITNKVGSFIKIITSEMVFSHKWTILNLSEGRLGMFYAFFKNSWYVLSLEATSDNAKNLIIFTESIIPEIENLVNLYFIVNPEVKWKRDVIKQLYEKFIHFMNESVSSDDINSHSSDEILTELS